MRFRPAGTVLLTACDQQPVPRTWLDALYRRSGAAQGVARAMRGRPAGHGRGCLPRRRRSLPAALLRRAIPGRMNTTRWLNSRRFRRASIRPQMNCQRAPFRSLRPRIRHERRDHHRPFPRYVLALHRLGLRLIAGRSGISHRHAHRHRHDDRWPVLGHEPRHRPGRRRDRQAAAQGALCRRVRLHHRQLQLAGEHRVPLVRRLGNHRYRLDHHDGELSSAGPAGEDRHRRSRADSGTDRGHGWVPRGVREHRPYRGSVHRLAGGDPLLLRAGTVQLFITLIEFKLTTLAGFVLIPFALWNKTSFLAEKVLGNVVSSGIKVLVLVPSSSALVPGCLPSSRYIPTNHQSTTRWS